MADAQMEEKKARRKKRQERAMERYNLRCAEMYWDPNQDKSDHEDFDPGRYFMDRWWDNDEITDIPPMCYTDDPSGRDPRDALQICSIKIASITGGLQWPLDVFGMVAARDVLNLDRKRNIIFARPRSNCQTITEEHPYLALTGPTRAVVTSIDLGNIEVVLKVKGPTKPEDKDLSFIVLTLKSSGYCSFHRDYTSKHSTLKLAFHHIHRSVEATIIMRVIGGSSLPSPGFRGVFTASTASIDDVEVMLLAFEDGELPIAEDGTINLSRRVVSVGLDDGDQLNVSIVARSDKYDERGSTRDDIIFTPKRAGRSCGVLNVGSFKMQVMVAWSMFW